MEIRLEFEEDCLFKRKKINLQFYHTSKSRMQVDNYFRAHPPYVCPRSMLEDISMKPMIMVYVSFQ